MFLQVGTYIGSGYSLELVPDSPTPTVRNYQIVSRYDIIDGPYPGSYQITVQDIYASTNLPTDLYTGVLVGDGNLFSGADEYQGTMTITADELGNPKTAVFVQPSDATTSSTAFFQKQCMAPLLADC